MMRLHHVDYSSTGLEHSRYSRPGRRGAQQVCDPRAPCRTGLGPAPPALLPDDSCGGVSRPWTRCLAPRCRGLAPNTIVVAGQMMMWAERATIRS